MSVFYFDVRHSSHNLCLLFCIIQVSCEEKKTSPEALAWDKTISGTVPEWNPMTVVDSAAFGFLFFVHTRVSLLSAGCGHVNKRL